LAFGTESIIVLELDRKNQSTDASMGATVKATARFYVLQGQLLGASPEGGVVFTGFDGQTGLPSGKLHGIRTFAVTGIPDDAVPFVNIEEPGDSAALLDAGRCHEREYWERETDHILASPTFAGQEGEIFCMLTFQKSPTDLGVQHACAQLLP